MIFKMKIFKQFIKFGIIGVSNTIIGYIIYAITLYTLQRFGWFPNLDIYISQFMMFLLSVAWSFYWNNKYVFKDTSSSKQNTFVALLKTYVSYAITSLFLSEVLLLFWVICLGINEYVAPILNLIITVPLNFIIQKYWAFNYKDKNI